MCAVRAFPRHSLATKGFRLPCPTLGATPFFSLWKLHSARSYLGCGMTLTGPCHLNSKGVKRSSHHDYRCIALCTPAI